MNNLLLVWTGRAIALLWAAWWTFFAFASAWAEGGWQRALLVGGLVALAFFGSALFAWIKERAGGFYLACLGLFFAALFPVGFFHAQSIGGMVFVLTTLALPPLVSGLLLYRDSRHHLDHPA
jgi:hypothetical protein